MITLLAAIVVFGILVTVHELGHFLTAKMTGMQVDEFAIGFGPVIYQNQTKETLYSLRAIPLGGYNKIAGMDPEDESDSANGFNSKPIPSRMLVILAGSLMNFLLPVILFFAIFAFSGIDEPVKEPVLGTVYPGKAAAQAGLMPEDKIVKINGEKITVWMDVIQKIRAAGENEVTITVDRAGSVRDYKMKAVFDKELGRPLVGISPKFEKKPLSIVESGKMSLLYTKNVAISMVRGLYRIITGTDAAKIAGPLGVAQMAGSFAEQGVLPLLNFIALLSINLAVVNLLPIPALDGGHFVVLLVEAIRGKPLAPKYMNAIQMVGFAIIIAIFVFSTYNDILRL